VSTISEILTSTYVLKVGRGIVTTALTVVFVLGCILYHREQLEHVYMVDASQMFDVMYSPLVPAMDPELKRYALHVRVPTTRATTITPLLSECLF